MSLDEGQTSGGFDFYGPQYARDGELAVEGWRTAAEQDAFSDLDLDSVRGTCERAAR